MKIIRNYNRLVNEIINLNIPFKVEIIGYLDYGIIYPFLGLTSISKTATRSVVLTSGVHGDEFYAIHVVLKWLQQIKLSEYSDFNWSIFPVINPFGYATGSRENGARQDVNSDNKFYKHSKVQELALLFDAFPLNPDIVIDVHGDTGKSAIYAYERKTDDKISIAEKSLAECDHIFPYDRSKTIYTDKAVNGVIYTQDENVGIEGAMERLGVEYTISLELPGRANGQKRATGGIAILNSIFRNFRDLSIKDEKELSILPELKV